MSWRPEQPIHHARAAAESFGDDAARYDRSRPRYPDPFYDRLLSESPGRHVLDVGAGTGIVGAALAARGAAVLGVEVDERMTAFARERHDLDIEVARFEDWDAAGRKFDAVVSGTAWHWVDPEVGPARAAEVLADDGLIALVWNLRDLAPEIAEAFAAAYERETRDAPFARGMRLGMAASEPILDAAADGLDRTGAFGAVERWRTDWTATATRDEWLDQLASFGGHNLIEPEAFARLAEAHGAAIDAAGGGIELRYATVTVAARRLSRSASASG